MEQGDQEPIQSTPEAITLPKTEVVLPPQPEVSTPTETASVTENASTTASTENRIQEIKEQLSEVVTPSFMPEIPEETKKFDGVFFSVDNYFGKNNHNKTGYAILGYEAMAPVTFWKTIIDSAKKYLPNPEERQNMADIGCAYGYLLKHISPEFKNTYGLDISRTALEKAREASPTSHLLETNLNQEVLPFADESMDMLTILDAVEHVGKPEALLEQAYSKLRNGGLAVISTPDIGNWFGKLIAKANGDPSHINLFAQKDLVTKLESLGFEILEKHPFFPLGPFRIPIPANVEIVARKKSTEPTNT